QAQAQAPASAQESARAQGPLNSPSGAGAGADAARQGPEPTVTSMAATTPSSLQVGASSGRSVVTEEDTSTDGLSPLRGASLVLGLLAVGLFIASVLLRRVAMAPIDGRFDGADGWRPPAGR